MTGRYLYAMFHVVVIRNAMSEPSGLATAAPWFISQGGSVIAVATPPQFLDHDARRIAPLA